MPPEHLIGVVAKILRAQEHFQALHKEITEYLVKCRDATQLPTRINTESNSVRLTFQPMHDPSVVISMMIGDCVHNVRCALDHLWKRMGGEGNFPLFGDVHSPNNWLAQKNARLKGVPTGAHGIIDGLQPCYLGQKAPTHPLSILNRLSNVDKHDAIHLTRPRSKNTRIAFREKGSSHEVAVLHPPVIFHDHTEVVLHGAPSEIKPGMDVNIQGTLFVSFKETGPWGDEAVQTVLRDCILFVKDSVVSPLIPFTR